MTLVKDTVWALEAKCEGRDFSETRKENKWGDLLKTNMQKKMPILAEQQTEIKTVRALFS